MNEYITIQSDTPISGWIGIIEDTDYPELGFNEIKPTIELASQNNIPPILAGYDYLIHITYKKHEELQINEILSLKTPEIIIDQEKEIENAKYN